MPGSSFVLPKPGKYSVRGNKVWALNRMSLILSPSLSPGFLSRLSNASIMLSEKEPSCSFALNEFQSSQRHILKFLKSFKKSLIKYIEFYNNKRPHGYLCNRTPSKAEAEYYQYLSQKENNSNRTQGVQMELFFTNIFQFQHKFILLQY